MKQPILSAGLTLLLINNAQAIAEALPAKDLSLEQEKPELQRPENQLLPPSRGELLYSNHCLECHESSVHIRAKHHARNIDGIRNEVARWTKQLQLKWSVRDIEDVVDFLNNRYYHYSD